MSGSRRSTTGGPKVPYYPQSAHIEAAKYLRLTATRYIAGRATLNDVQEAMAMLVAAAPVSGEPGHRGAVQRAPVKRCTSKGGGDYRGPLRCGLPAGHDGEHYAITPSCVTFLPDDETKGREP